MLNHNIKMPTLHSAHTPQVLPSPWQPPKQRKGKIPTLPQHLLVAGIKKRVRREMKRALER